MWNQLSDIAPKAVVAAVLLWGGANYLLIGPEVAARVVRADYMPICEATHRTWAVRAGEDMMQSVPVPGKDREKEYAAQKLRQFQENPFFKELNNTGLGGLFDISGMSNATLSEYEDQKRAATNAYNQAVARIKQQTATTLGKSGEICGCVADAAIADTHSDWAIFSGTLGLIRPASLKSFDSRMAQVQADGHCMTARAGS